MMVKKFQSFGCRPGPSTDNDSESLVRTSPGNLLDDRNYDERVGEGEHLAQLRSNSMIIKSTLSRLGRNIILSHFA